MLFQTFLTAVSNALGLGGAANAGYFLGLLCMTAAIVAVSYFMQGQIYALALTSTALIILFVFLGWFDFWLLLLNVLLIAGFWGIKIGGS